MDLLVSAEGQRTGSRNPGIINISHRIKPCILDNHRGVAKALSRDGSTPHSTAALSRLGAMTVDTNLSLSFQMLARRVSPGKPGRQSVRRRTERGSSR
jgi:hypothetical protein